MNLKRRVKKLEESVPSGYFESKPLAYFYGDMTLEEVAEWNRKRALAKPEPFANLYARAPELTKEWC